MACPVYDPIMIINLDEESTYLSPDADAGRRSETCDNVLSKVAPDIKNDDDDDDYEDVEDDEDKDEDETDSYSEEFEDCIEPISRKNKVMILAVILFSALFLSEVILRYRSIVSNNGSVEVTRRIYNLVWNLGYLYRDHDAYLLCTTSNATEEWLQRDLNHFEDIYIRAKHSVRALEQTSSEYNDFAEAFIRTDDSPSWTDGNLSQANTSSLLSTTMIAFRTKIIEIASRKESRDTLLDIGATVGIWLFSMLFYYAWRCIEKLDDTCFESKKRGEVIPSFIHDVAVPIIVADITMTIQDANEAVSAVFGWRTDEMIGKNVTMLMPHSLRKNHQKYVDYYLMTQKAGIIGNTKGRTIAGIHKDGLKLDLILNLSVSGENQQKNPMFTALFQDVTEGHRAQHSHKVKEEALNCIIAAQNQLLTKLNAPVIIANEQMIICQVNSAARDTFGWTEEEMLGKNVKIFMKSTDASKHDAHVGRYKATGKKRVIGQTRRIEAVHRDGSELSLILNMAKSTDAAGTRYIAIFHDDTKR